MNLWLENLINFRLSMASLSPPFILCPLPDRKALLGIRQDSSVNKAIVTLGKNIAIRYHVLEQKQESSWTTSRYWFTSPVTYCYDFGKYGAVLNHNIIALWQEADATLSNISKIKPNGRTVVVMKNGNVAYLDDVSETKSLVKDAILSGGPSKITSCNNEIDGEGAEKVNSRCEFGSDTDKMLGSCLHKDISESFVAYFGSDGCIRKKKLMAGSNEIDRIKLANLSKYISKANPVTMCPLADNSSIAIYGSDPAEEGAVVIIYDIHYDLVATHSSSRVRITKSLLSAVVGKHQAKLDEEAYPVIWETIQQVKVFENEGQPEAVICNHVIPAALEANNSSALDWILDTFSDIPEVHVVSMVVFSLKEVKESNEVNERLNKLLLRKFDKQLLTSSLRHIPYEEVKKLLGYLNALIETNWELKIDYEDESSMKSWLKWCSALIDAHYTKFVLHSETDIIENLLQAICECTKVMEAVQEMEPFLVLTYSKTSFEPNSSSISRWRTETITFE
ncbi:Nucleolar protein 11-like [Orchesella cincta]|uniref:Nucleolar protein 11-like n=1 Tax=Orchesella cincta TaxID=48709 RepID=A0A1D2M363_ORCCI|nr:Nucleolar protein 11-like [Orchesella cincta]